MPRIYVVAGFAHHLVQGVDVAVVTTRAAVGLVLRVAVVDVDHIVARATIHEVAVVAVAIGVDDVPTSPAVYAVEAPLLAEPGRCAAEANTKTNSSASASATSIFLPAILPPS